jgi:hypothetical protein
MKVKHNSSLSDFFYLFYLLLYMPHIFYIINNFIFLLVKGR